MIKINGMMPVYHLGTFYYITDDVKAKEFQTILSRNLTPEGIALALLSASLMAVRSSGEVVKCKWVDKKEAQTILDYGIRI